MVPSKWPRSPSHGKSRQFCGSLRNCGRSHHQRLRKTFDGHAFKANKAEECVPCQGKSPDETSNVVRTVWMPEPSTPRRPASRQSRRSRPSTPIRGSSGESRIRLGRKLLSSARTTPSWASRSVLSFFANWMLGGSPCPVSLPDSVPEGLLTPNVGNRSRGGFPPHVCAAICEIGARPDVPRIQERRRFSAKLRRLSASVGSHYAPGQPHPVLLF